MKSQIVIEAADLFCGGGGTSEGMMQAAAMLSIRVRLTALNHDRDSIKTHGLNHPGVRHIRQPIENVDPRKAVPSGRLNLLAGSPECIYHSNARQGAGPCNDQSRAGAWHLTDWCTKLRVDDIFMENVREFVDWGPLDRNGYPVSARKGEYFKAWVLAMEAMRYRVEWGFKNAAEFGDPTDRIRFILIARSDKRQIKWPSPTHGIGLKPFRTAREIVDFSIKGRSIYNRKKKLAENTVRRIQSGINKFHGQPFLIKLRGTSDSHIDASARSLDLPMPTLTAGGEHLALVEPQAFIIKYYGTGTAQSLDLPLDTITTLDRFALVEPTRDGDILLRMFQPHELAAGMSFPKKYQFVGTRRSKIRQIGNAVPVELAKAHTLALLRNN